MKGRRYVIVNRKRFFIFTMIFLIGIALILFSILSISGVYSISTVENFEEYCIKKGDTLWEIAIEFAPEGYDTRKFIYDIKEHNNMESSMIYKGEKLFIPVMVFVE